MDVASDDSGSEMKLLFSFCSAREVRPCQISSKYVHAVTQTSNIIRKSERMMALNETSVNPPRANQVLCLWRDVCDVITAREASFFPSLYLWWCNRFALCLCAGV